MWTDKTRVCKLMQQAQCQGQSMIVMHITRNWQPSTPVLHGRQEACRVSWQALQCIVGKGRLSDGIHIDILSSGYLTDGNLRIMLVCSDRASRQP